MRVQVNVGLLIKETDTRYVYKGKWSLLYIEWFGHNSYFMIYMGVFWIATSIYYFVLFCILFFNHLLLVFLLLLVITLLGSSHLLALNAAGATTTKRRGEGEVNVLLGVKTDNEGWDVDDLLADTINTR